VIHPTSERIDSHHANCVAGPTTLFSSSISVLIQPTWERRNQQTLHTLIALIQIGTPTPMQKTMSLGAWISLSRGTCTTEMTRSMRPMAQVCILKILCIQLVVPLIEIFPYHIFFMLHRISFDNNVFFELHPDFFFIKDQESRKILLQDWSRGVLLSPPMQFLHLNSCWTSP
jgi:hypothetical protein